MEINSFDYNNISILNSGIFSDLDSATFYAQNHNDSFLGQILTVIEIEQEKNLVNLYQISCLNENTKSSNKTNWILSKINEGNSTIKIWKKAPSSTRFKVKVSANTADERSIGQIIPFPNETVTIDWGDNEQTEVTISQEKIQHKFPEISEDKEYIVSISDNAQTVKIGKKINPIEAISWGKNVENVKYCYFNCSELTGNIPEWGEKIINAEGCFLNCSQLTGNIPEWNSILTNVSYCYNSCSQLTGNIPAWNSTITDAKNCYSYCSNLTGPIPAWNLTITDANNCYQNCSNLTGNIPEWSETLTNVSFCFENCSQLTGIWDPSAPIEEICPSRFKYFESKNCVNGCNSEKITLNFLPTWGGTYKNKLTCFKVQVKQQKSNKSTTDSENLKSKTERKRSFFIKKFENETVTIDWGDGSISSLSDEQYNTFEKVTHKFPASQDEDKEFIVSISDNIEKIKISTNTTENSLLEQTEQVKILNIFSFGDKVTEVEQCFWGCDALQDFIPEWKPSLTNANNCYRDCKSLKTKIPEWTTNIKFVESCYYGCNQLTGNIPEWGSNITNVSYCYKGCLQLTGPIPAWNSTITNAKYCYNSCSGLSGIWDPTVSIEEVCPERITDHNDCVTGCSKEVKDYFLQSWGGNK